MQNVHMYLADSLRHHGTFGMGQTAWTHENAACVPYRIPWDSLRCHIYSTFGMGPHRIPWDSVRCHSTFLEGGRGTGGGRQLGHVYMHVCLIESCQVL